MTYTLLLVPISTKPALKNAKMLVYMMLLKQRNQSHNRDAANDVSDVNQVNSYSFRTHFHKPSDNIN
jgi:hypothetical protein